MLLKKYKKGGKAEKKKNTADYSYMNKPIGGEVEDWGKPKSILIKDAQERAKAMEKLGLKMPKSACGSLPLGKGGKKKIKKMKFGGKVLKKQSGRR